MSRVAVAVSGGVDSLCALLLVKGEGHDVVALHGMFTPQTPQAGLGASDALPGLQLACDALDVPLHVADLREVFFRKVITPFGQDYADGLTPNPCALCNRQIKFGALLEAAFALGAEKLATGHYARLLPAQNEGDAHLYAARDKGRDQSYFLSLVAAKRLCRALFPLAERSKDWCAAKVAQAGLKTPLPASSQDICFVGKNGADALYTCLLALWESLDISPPGPGPVLLDEGAGSPRKIGDHQGLWRYTEGQRRGLALAHTEPLHVLTKDKERNTLVVGGKALLGIRACSTDRANFLCDPARWPKRLFARLRYRRPAAAAQVRLRDDGGMDIFLEAEDSPTAPGQLAVIYDAEDRVLAGGVITRIHPSRCHGT